MNVTLSSLALSDEPFVLLAPTFARSQRWVLLRNPRVATPRDSRVVWLARYETHGRDAVALTGDFEDVTVELEATPTSLTWALDDEAGFVTGLAVIREAIAAGDVYQVNLTRPATVECASGAHFLSTLCRRGTPRFGAWCRLHALGLGEFVTASPELLFELDLTTRVIRAEPMKGTAAPAERAWLAASVKDQAELAMITDLVRDDLNHLCVARSVEVPASRRYIELPYVVQAVSDVTGVLRPEVSLAQVFAQLHPGGSVTGAPRESARSLIAQLEPRPRGFYCGFLALEQQGRVCSALLIRTAQREGPASSKWHYGVGGGITWDSNAPSELAELRIKLGALNG